MVNKVDEQSYISYMMNRLPEAKKGKVHKMEKGDNLWKLAKQELNKSDASNQEISEYMLLIAKLNKLETFEKMNSIKVSDEIYLPEKAKIETADTVQPKTMTKTSAKMQQTKKELTDAEKGFAAVKDALLNDKTIHVTRAYPNSLNLYHVYQHYKNEKTGYVSKYHPVISFTLDNQGKFRDASFEGMQDVDKYGYDYDIDKNGSIKRRDIMRKGQQGQVNPNDMKQVKNILVSLSKQAVTSY